MVVAALHSQLPAVAVAFKDRAPDATLAYVMTDGGALPAEWDALTLAQLAPLIPYLLLVAMLALRLSS